MLSKIISASVNGIEASIVQVEVDLSQGLPSFYMTGYLAAQVREAQERVKTAIKNIGHTIPPGRIVVNISPADVRKSGTMLDLPIAVGILADMNLFNIRDLSESMFIGELSLDGSVNSIRGVLPMICAARDCGIKRCFLPESNLRETHLIRDIEFYGVKSVRDVIDIINLQECNCNAASNQEGNSAGNSEGNADSNSEGNADSNSEGNADSNPETESEMNLEINPASKAESNLKYNDNTKNEFTFENIHGQRAAKRAMMIAVAGRHNIIMSGPPGSGKTMLASSIPSIMPDMTDEEILECSKIYSCLGLLPKDTGCIAKRPLRSPHHTISSAALIGGGVIPIPGEITLAHNGILFMDELTKFRSEVMEALRQPIEEHSVRIMRNGCMSVFPADFVLVAAMNPCKCGYYPDRNLCRCSELDIARHIGKLSRPFLDRFDLAVHIDKLSYNEVSGKNHTEGKLASSATGQTEDELTSSAVKKKIFRAIEAQQKRYYNKGILFNSQMSPAQLKKYCVLDEGGERLMKMAYNRYDLSARGYNKLLKVARTIADLEGAENVNAGHISEAICFRNMELGGDVNG